MPNPSFFDAMEANGGMRFGPPSLPDAPGMSPQQYVQNLRLKAGYNNTWGTNIGAEYEPNTGTFKGNVDIPLGSHATGWKAGVSAYARPSFMGGPTDTGAMFTLGKKTLEQVDAADVLNKVSPNLRTLLENNPAAAEELRMQEFNRRNNFNQPGTDKFKFYGGFDINAPGGPPNPQQFLRQNIQQGLGAPNE
jgi:hypothetical protein